jgi:hypothetical protein
MILSGRRLVPEHCIPSGGEDAFAADAESLGLHTVLRENNGCPLQAAEQA